MPLDLSRETRFSGLPISPGVACGPVCLFNDRRHAQVPERSVVDEERGREKMRLNAAMQVVAEQLHGVIEDVARRVGAVEAGIFAAQQMIVEDPELRKEILEAIEAKGRNAELAVAETLERYEARMRESGQELFQERAADVREIKHRLLGELGDMVAALRCGDAEHCQRGKNRVIVAEELTPSLTTLIDAEHTLGFVTERGGAASHAAILARALGIPAVSGVPGIHDMLRCGVRVLLDGNTGEVVVQPSQETMQSQMPDVRVGPAPGEVVGPVEGLKVLANISRAEDVAGAVAMKAEGIGLYRTEFEFLAADRILTEDEQHGRYASVLDAMKGAPVYFRLADIGGDKAAPFLDLPAEENPYLGFRGSRLLLGRPEILETQARALARAASAGPVCVVYPMVVELEQFVELKKRFEAALPGPMPSDLKHGVMLEVPGACLQARPLLEAADFGTIGTNDLIQYLFAVDRNNELVAADYHADRPVFWALLADVAKAAQEAGRPLSVCGELAGKPEYLTKLIHMGIRSVSVSSRLIPTLRRSLA